MRDEVTWAGHATVALRIGGVRVLADPLLTERVVHLRRRTPSPDPALAAADLVLVSHAHHDHLDRRSLRRVAAASPHAEIVTPFGTARLLRDLGWRAVHEVTPGEVLDVAGVRLRVTEARHRGGRGRREDPGMRAVGYVVERAGRRVYLAGDTDLFDAMADLGRPDLAAVPIAGWWRSLGPGHLDAERAAEAVARIDPGRVLPIHWGTLAPGVSRRRPAWLDQPVADFAAALARRGLQDRLLRLEPGRPAAW